MDLLRRTEAAEIMFLTAAVDAARRRGHCPDAFVEPVLDGTALYVAPGWPLNKVLGLGVGEARAPSPAIEALDSVQDRLPRSGVSLPVELSDAVAPELAQALEAAGYLEVEREVVSVLDPRAVAIEGVPPVACEVVTPETEGDWIQASLEGFAVPADGPAHAEFPAAILRQVFADRLRIDGTTCWLARVEGHVAGAAALHVEGQIGLLCGATTLPAFRRRGVQTTLLATRLVEARERGCSVVVVTTPEASASAASVRAAGFEPLHVRRLLERGG